MLNEAKKTAVALIRFIIQIKIFDCIPGFRLDLIIFL